MSNLQFSEASESELRDLPEMQLRSHLSRLNIEVKRINTELERRTRLSEELTGIKRNEPVLARKQELAKTDKQLEREEKQRETIKAAMAILNQSVASGKFTKEQLINLAKKGIK